MLSKFYGTKELGTTKTMTKESSLSPEIEKNLSKLQYEISEIEEEEES